jgi:tetratricopeptide (TPR) repeat protein
MFYNVSAAYGALPPRSALPKAEDLLSKGLALDENSASLHSTLGMLRVFQWRWAEAEQAYQRAISLEPTNAFPHMNYPILCSFLGRPNMGRKLNDGLPLGEGHFGYVAGVLGYAVEARSVVRELEARRERGYSAALPIAWTYLGLGETVMGLEWLETALAERDPFLGSALVFPGYDAIRDQPRFRRLTNELKLSTT